MDIHFCQLHVILFSIILIQFLIWVSILASQNLDIIGVKFDSNTLTFEDYVRGMASRVSQRIGLCRYLCVTRCYYLFVLQNLQYFSPVLGSAADCHLQRPAEAPGGFDGQALP